MSYLHVMEFCIKIGNSAKDSRLGKYFAIFLMTNEPNLIWIEVLSSVEWSTPADKFS